MSAAFDAVLRELRAVHAAHSAIRAFCDFPGDLAALPLVPRYRPCAGFMAREAPMEAGDLAPLRDALLAAAPDALWRETYAGTGMGEHFMERFGCYCIVGPGGRWSSASMNAWLIYLPAGFWYPWHRHPAAEMYLVVAGRAEFLREGAPTETLGPGGTVFHANDQPHAMRTGEGPVLACALWRDRLGIAPVWTPDPR